MIDPLPPDSTRCDMQRTYFATGGLQWPIWQCVLDNGHGGPHRLVPIPIPPQEKPRRKWWPA